MGDVDRRGFHSGQEASRSEGDLTAAGAVSALAAALAKNSNTPLIDARALVKEVTGLDDAGILAAPDRLLSALERAALEALASRRRQGESVAHILGRREFWSLTFRVGQGLLVPRPDSETVVEAALAACPDAGAQYRALDLGAGTGCLLAAFLSERPNACGVGVDKNPGAARCAAENLGALGLASRACVVIGDWGRAISGRFDAIIANPPYLKRADAEQLPIDVRDYEDPGALFGGVDGLDAYRRILDDAPRLLADRGALILEIGWDQKDAVGELAIQRFPGADIVARADLAGRPRALTIRPVSGN